MTVQLSMDPMSAPTRGLPMPAYDATGWPTLPAMNSRGDRNTGSLLRGTKPQHLKGLGVPELLDTENLACRSTYPSQGVLFLQGDAADAVYYICSGKVQVTVVSQQGKEGVIAMLSEGDFVGECSLAGQPIYLATATTTTACDIVRIPRDVMRRMVRENGKLAEYFMAFLLKRTVQVEEDLTDQLFNSSEKRLARVLLLLANFGKDGKLDLIPEISQDRLAQRVGTTRSRINFFMNKFRRLGLIEYNGQGVTVHSGLLNVIVQE